MSSARATDAPELNSIPLKSRQFRIAREASWKELEALLARENAARATVLTPDELLRLAMLYRSALSSLSVARSIAIDVNLQSYLENLCLRAFLCVYAPRSQPSEVLRHFAEEMPRGLHRLRLHLGIAAIVILIGGVSGYTLVAHNPVWAQAVLSTGTLGQWSAARNFFAHGLPLVLLAVGLGVFLALPTLALLAWQGVFIGAFVAAQSLLNLRMPGLMAQMLPQTISLTLAGAAGLRLAQAVLMPGSRTRAASIELATPEIASGAAAAIAALAVLTLAASAIWT